MENHSPKKVQMRQNTEREKTIQEVEVQQHPIMPDQDKAVPQDSPPKIQVVGRITIEIMSNGEFMPKVESVYPFAVPTILETVAQRIHDELVQTKQR